MKIKKQIDINRFLPGVQKNIPLAKYTTFRIGGKAKYFFVAKTKKDLIKAVAMAKKLKLPFFILGRGSNLLVPDEGYKGLIIKFQNPKSKIQINSKIQNPKIYVEAGAMLGELVNATAKAGLSGLEWAAGIPGTVGGAVYGNCGAFGKSIADIVESVEVLDINKIPNSKTEFPFMETKLKKRTKSSSPFQIPNKFQISNFKIQTKILRNHDCRFGYRESIFKKNKNLIITFLTLKLKKREKKEIENKIKQHLSYRKIHQPLNFPSVGSIFQNQKSKTELPFMEAKVKKRTKSSSPFKNQKLLKEFFELKEFNKKGLIPIGWLIDKCGLKGKKIGEAQISKIHANFIVNRNRAKAKDVKKLINLMKKKVKQKFGLVLKEEIEYL